MCSSRRCPEAAGCAVHLGGDAAQRDMAAAPLDAADGQDIFRFILRCDAGVIREGERHGAAAGDGYAFCEHHHAVYIHFRSPPVALKRWPLLYKPRVWGLHYNV